MTTIQKILNTTVKVTVNEDYDCPSHIEQEFNSLDDAVSYMKRNGVIYKPIRQGVKLVTLEIEQTEEAKENWYHNAMKLSQHEPDLPDNTYK